MKHSVAIAGEDQSCHDVCLFWRQGWERKEEEDDTVCRFLFMKYVKMTPRGGWETASVSRLLTAYLPETYTVFQHSLTTNHQPQVLVS